MTINKAQGQTLKAVGVDLSEASFSHGMFYVAASRTGTPDHLWVYAPQKQTNVVYHEVL
jgi:ATP-dependent exoDNAse (exonuclease V) alpha subunit